MNYITDGKTESGKNRSMTGLLVFIALTASCLIGGQLYLIAFQGESACLNEGCGIVEGLTRVSPLVFNLFGLLFFLAVALSATVILFRPSVLHFLSLLLLSAMAVEGVLLAYQYHVALTWCSYCLIIFGFVTLCNLMLGLRQFFSGIVLVAAAGMAFALLRFEPVLLDQDGGLAAGTAAVRPGPMDGRGVFIIYSNDCQHCMTLLRKLPGLTDCTVRLNPIGEPPPADIPGLERMPSFQPKVNLRLLSMLQIDTVPVLVVPDNGGYRIIRSESGIEAYFAANCLKMGTFTPLEPEIIEPESSFLDFDQSFFPQDVDDECRVDVECDEPLPGYVD